MWRDLTLILLAGSWLALLCWAAAASMAARYYADWAHDAERRYGEACRRASAARAECTSRGEGPT